MTKNRYLLTLLIHGRSLSEERLNELLVAKAWGLTPGQWDRLPDVDKAEMIAFEQSETTMHQCDTLSKEELAGWLA